MCAEHDHSPTPRRLGPGCRLGFSLLEVIVVLSVSAFLISLLMPAVQQVRSSATRSSCQNKLHQIALAVHSYESAAGVLPVKLRQNEYGPGGWHAQGLTWFAHITPQMGDDALWAAALQAYALGAPPTSNPPHIGLAVVVGTFVCPADGRLATPQRSVDGTVAAFTSYLGVKGSLSDREGLVRANGVLTDGDATVRMSDIVDGAANTLMLGERPPDDQFYTGWWYTHPPELAAGPSGSMYVDEAIWLYDLPCAGLQFYRPGSTTNRCDRFHFWSLHAGGGNWAFADGSVRFLSYGAAKLMPALASRDGGEAVKLPD